ncbi:MAG: response regulator [Desulfovibrio sp.]|nr:response regulator [Desulfovibrio sp.]
MKNEQSNNIMRLAIAASIIVALILILGTFFAGQNANHDTEKAVHAVSLLYLDELSERREQVVSSALQSYISNIDVAIGLIEKNDLQSVETLQAYQSRMKQLYGLEKFAFVDSEGLIYTSRGTRTDIDQYNFDYKNLSSPNISIKYGTGNNKKIVIAMPVDRLPLGDKRLVVCFMEMDMERMLKNISMQAMNNNITFCNIYTSDGRSLTNVVLGGLANTDNLLKTLETAVFEDKASIDGMRDDFKSHRAGVVSFTYEGIRETMSYVPVHGTNWMLTYLIRESIISDKISDIYEGIVSRNLMQSVFTVLVLATLFTLMLLQRRKAAKITLEKEISETENRVKRQELEEQLALQQQLLQQEKERVQQDNMITALASDYRSVYYVSLDENTCLCYRHDTRLEDTVLTGENQSFSETFADYAHRFIDEKYRKDFLAFIEPQNIRDGLSKQRVLTYRYLVKRDEQELYEMVRIARMDHEDDARQIKAVGLGIADIDTEMRDSMQKSQALSDALKAAEEASRAKTIFLSNMSHEIRTPMNAIIGLNTLALNESDLSPRTKDYLTKIGGSAQHLLSLINDILDMSRIESGRMAIRNEEFAFAKLLEKINTIFSVQCQEKGLTYLCHIQGEVDDYYIGDNVKLRQVLINILGNAVKFTPKGGTVDFQVEKTASFDGKSTLRFTIKDTGVGMSKEFLPKLFETFSQEDSSASNKYGSSGLGMAITKNIVEMMNGQITVEREKGVGSCFTVVVTLLDSEKSKASKTEDIDLNAMNLSILVIDDDPVACEHAKLVLEKAGLNSETVVSSKEALEMVKLRHARRDPYNLIIVDWQMPEMDGIETTRKIRSVIGQEAAIIILTAYNWDDIMEEALSAGVDSFITKPLFTSNLLEEFKNTLVRKQITPQTKTKKADLRGRRILLAEDMIVNAEIMIEVLQMREMLVEHAENGKIAVEMFSNHEVGYYAAILMDMRMPELNGLEATRAIHAMAREDAKTIPIIALTANAFDEDVQQSLQAGLNAHLSKPVNPEVLFETLENML